MSREYPMVTVSHIGYVSTNYDLSKGIKNHISLERVLTPVVPKTINRKIDYYETHDPDVVAYPLIGAEVFENKLLNVNNPDTGFVQLQFKIAKSGKLSALKVLESNCASCEFLAEELLMQSGKWRTTPPYQEIEMTLNLQFKKD